MVVGVEVGGWCSVFGSLRYGTGFKNKAVELFIIFRKMFGPRAYTDFYYKNLMNICPEFARECPEVARFSF